MEFEVCPQVSLSYPSIGKSNGHDCCSLHDPGEWIPHESQKLENFALLRTSKSQIEAIITSVKLTIRHNPRVERKGNQTSFSSSLLGPKISRRCCACWVERPSRLHLRFSNTSSRGQFSCRKDKQHQLSDAIPCLDNSADELSNTLTEL